MAERFYIEMYSVSMSVQFVFQFLIMVFLAVAMAVSIGLVLLGIGLIAVRSPSKQRVGDNGRLHPRDSTFFQ